MREEIVRTQQWLLDQMVEDLRKLNEGSVDLDVAKTKQAAYKNLIRLADLSLQSARIYEGRTFPNGGVPLLYTPGE